MCNNIILTSVDYANIIRSMAYRLHGVRLNKTQVNKLLYMCYGFYLVATSKRLFDEQPHAWPYGPVFPTVYKSFDRYQPPFSINEDRVRVFTKDQTAVHIIRAVIDNYCHVSAYDLSMWSHKPGGPWNITAYGKDGNKKPVWNKVIDDSLISDYFSPKSHE